MITSGICKYCNHKSDYTSNYYKCENCYFYISYCDNRQIFYWGMPFSEENKYYTIKSCNDKIYGAYTKIYKLNYLS